MARKATYREIGGPDGHLANRRNFRGNSMSAVQWAEEYCVYSYGTLIAVAYERDVIVSNRYYSHTTSRHQNLCRAWL